jgi:endonuclease I
MKQTLLSLLLISLFIFTKAQPPATYYNTAAGKTGATLKTALYNIIKGHTDVGYDGLYNAYKISDVKPDGSVWDMYSNCTFSYTNYADRCGNYSKECDCFNREHSFPQSWFNSSSPMKADMFHVYPTDGKVNGIRNNYPYGTTSSTNPTGNGSKLGPCTFPGYTGTVFEPIDEYKGDLARGYFYMATRYENLIASWQSNGNADEILNGTSFPCFDPWFLNLLAAWNASDPVSQKEIDRNNKIYTSFQHSRNPFIDHPEYANLIWGTNTNISETPVHKVLQVYPNPVSDMCTVSVPADLNQQNTVFTVYSSSGIPVFAPVNMSGDKAVLNLENVPSGFYLVRLTNNNYSTIYQSRIIKK